MLRYLRGEAGPSPRPALFLDRDGVLNRHIADGYVVEPGDFGPIDLAMEAATAARANGAALVVVTNQGAIARGRATEAGVMAIHALLVDSSANSGSCSTGCTTALTIRCHPIQHNEIASVASPSRA
jgi:D-glycero-D-manno-heptose 1,7-bisphosphate phosphatase